MVLSTVLFKHAIRQLKRQCEIKLKLSRGVNVTIEIDSLHENKDFYEKMNVKEFDELCEKVFKVTIECVEKALSSAKLNKTKIQDIISFMREKKLSTIICSSKTKFFKTLHQAVVNFKQF